MFIIDVESSGLSDESYPIEIAFCSIEEDKSDSFLIEPADDWVYWDSMSEELYHHIPYESLSKQGVSVHQGAIRLNKALSSETVLTDGLEWDSFWLKRLFDAAGTIPSFKLQFGILINSFLLNRLIYSANNPFTSSLLGFTVNIILYGI